MIGLFIAPWVIGAGVIVFLLGFFGGLYAARKEARL
jgi:hypothetical protein